jgi:hypothetical protein
MVKVGEKFGKEGEPCKLSHGFFSCFLFSVAHDMFLRLDSKSS